MSSSLSYIRRRNQRRIAMELLPQTDPEASIPKDVKEPPAEKETPPPKSSSSYAAKKSVAQRMMDIALLTSNANQLRYVFRFGRDSATFYLAISLICLSLVLQILVGLFLIFRPKKNLSPEEKDRANNVVIGGVFLITIVNILTSAFAVEDNPSTNQLAPFVKRIANISESE